MASFLGEIKRRKVFQVAAVYAVVAWLLVQIVATVEDPLSLPAWFDTAVIVLLAVGFPVAIILAWAYDVTPRGVERTGPSQTEPAETMPAKTGLAVNLTVIVVLLLLVVLVGLYVFLRAGTGTNTAGTEGRLPNSVAVLPFQSLSPDPSNDFFAVGVHEEILNQLAKIRDINVMARNSVLRYEGSGVTLADFAAELNVETIMEGTVRYAEDSVRITAQLIDAVTEAHLWSETFTRPFENIFEIETEIATAIANALEAELTPSEQASLARAPTDSDEAYALYLRALAELRGTTGGFRIGQEASTAFHDYLNRAIHIDPDFALAYATKARDYAYALGRDRALSAALSTRELEELAWHNAEEARRIDPNLGPAHGALAIVHRLNRRWGDAREAFQRALAASPNDATLVWDYMMFHFTVGEAEEGVALARRFVELNPSPSGYDQLGSALDWAGDLEAAERAFRVANEVGSTSPSSYANLALIVADRGGDLAEAFELLALAEGLVGADWPAYGLVEFLYTVGRVESAGSGADLARARQRLEGLRALETEIEIGAGLWAHAYLGLRNRGQTLEWLNRAAAEMTTIDNGFVALYHIAWNYHHDPLLEEPEFVEARRRLGFGFGE